jgi:malonyl CoA-acyl carrier protein transacylase/acyl carrier protein
MLSLEEALTLVAARGRLMGGLPRDGAMAAVMAGEAQVAEAVASFGRGVSIAAINGPLNTVVSGPEREVDALCASLGASGVVTTRLNVSHAFHSQLMDPILDAFLEEARRVSWRKPQIEIISNTTGAAIGAEAMRPEYWRTHARAPVRFADSIRALVQSGCKSFVEIGPHPTLLAMAQSCAPDADLLCLPSLKRGAADYQSILTSLSALFVAGAEIDWESFDRPFGPTPTQLATYPFHRERLWVDTAPQSRAATPPAAHPLLGWEVRQSLTDDRLFETHLGPTIQPYLADHRIQGALVAPSPVFMEMMVAAGRRLHGDIPLRLQHFELPQALLLSDDAPTTVQTSISPSGAVKIAAIDGDGWRAVASAEIDRDTDETIDAVDLEALRARLPDRLSADAYYTMLTGLGVALGPRFCGISDLWRKDGEALAQITPPEGVAGKGALALHPALLDACLQAMGAALPNAATLLSPFVLVSVDRVRIFQRVGAARLWAHASIRSGGGAEGRALVGDMRIYDEDGAVVALVDGAVFLPWRPRSNAANARVGEMLYEVKWKPARILPLDEIEAALAPEVDAIVEGGALTAYESFAEQLDELSALYVIAALRRLGWSLAQGSIATRDLADRLGVLPRHARLFARMLAILAEDGVLEPSGDAWRVVAAPPVVDPEAFADRLLAAHPDCAAELVLTRRCGAALADVLRGEADPLTLLFPGGSLADTERLYQSSPPARFYNRLVAEAVGAIAGAAGGRPLRILEVGAGTGSTTTYVLGKLAGRAYEYTFTDVSPLFLNRAREKFAGQPGMRYATFDLERDPGEQGFAPGEYDIIIAANVVHATRDLALSCSRLRSLLTSEGRLVLLEGATPQRFGDLTVGMLEGWWAFVDTQRRQYALISREAWSGVLKEAGFSDTVAVPPTGRTPVLDTQAVLIAAPQTSAPRRWLIAPDRNGMADRLADALRRTGRSVTILDPLSMTAQVRDAKGAIGVVLLTALDRSAKADAADLASGQRDFFTPALGLVRALAERAGPARLYIATCGAQATTAGERVEPTQASAWGFSHVVALEHPELGCTRVDLDPGADPAAAAAALADELCADAREDQVAFRNGARLVRRLVRRGPGLRVDLKPGIAESGAYLVTGGLRGLGLLVGEWLVDQGARHIVLMGRNAPGEPASQAIARMTERGARVVACRGDVSVREDVHRVVSEIGATGTPLAGVFHCAGVLDDGVLISQTWERFAPVLAPKVQGAWNLHEACGDAPLVLFASGASISGSGGQSNHAAANAFEDALAWMRQAEGKPSVSINWGPWAQVGAAADRTISATILKPISNADGLEALSMCLARAADGLFETSQLAVFDADWSSISGQAGARLFSEMAGEIGRSRRSDKSSRSEGPDSSWRARVLSSPADRQLAVLREEVRALVGSVLGATPASIDVDEPLRDLGLDSLMAVELRNRLGKATETTLPATVAFDYPTVQAMVDFLAAQRVFGLDPAAGQTGGGEAHSGEADRYQGQTEAELAAELMARLDRLKV